MLFRSGRPFPIDNVATLQFRTHVVSALFSVFDRVATGGFADSLVRQFVRLRHLVQDGGPRILNSSRSTEAVDRLRSFVVGYTRPEHALLHPSELLFCAQVEVFLGERDLRDKEWQAVRGLLDEIVYFPFARYIDEAAHEDFVKGRFGGAWEYPPADLLEEILVN